MVSLRDSSLYIRLHSRWRPPVRACVCVRADLHTRVCLSSRRGTGAREDVSQNLAFGPCH